MGWLELDVMVEGRWGLKLGQETVGVSVSWFSEWGPQQRVSVLQSLIGGLSLGILSTRGHMVTMIGPWQHLD